MIQRSVSIPFLLTLYMLSIYILVADVPMIIEIVNIPYSIVVGCAILYEVVKGYKERNK